MELLPASLKLGTKKRKRTYGRLSGKKHPWHLDYEVAAEQSNTCLYVPVLIKETNSQPMDQADGNTGTCITDGSKAAASGILRCNNCLRTESPQWRKGPPEAPHLCNACGARWMRTKALDAGGGNPGRPTAAVRSDDRSGATTPALTRQRSGPCSGSKRSHTAANHGEEPAAAPRVVRAKSFNDGGTRSRAPKAEVPDFKPHGGGMEALLGAIMMAEESMRPGGVFDDSDNESDGGASPAPESPPGRKEPARSSDGAKAQLTAGRSLHEPGVAVKADVDTHKVEEPSAMRPPGSSEARAPEGDGPEACGPEGIGRESDNRTTATTAAAGTAAAAAAAAAATGMPPWGMMAGAWQAARHNPMMAAAMAGYPPASMGLMSMGTPMRGFPSMGLMTGMPGGPMPWQTGFRGFMPFISPASQTPPAESADVGMVKEEEKEEDEEDDEFAAAVREAEKVVAPHVSAQGSGNVEEKEEVKPRTSAASLPPRAPEPERREDVGRLESAASCAADREMERAAMKEAQPASASQHEDVRRAVPEAEEDDELTEDDETVPGDRIRPMDSASLAPAEPATSTAATTAPIAAPPASWPENVRLMNLEVPAGGMSSGQWDPLSRICHKDAATLAREMKAAEARQNAQQRRAQKRAQQSKGRSSSISSAAPTMSPDPQPGKAVEAPKVEAPAAPAVAADPAASAASAEAAPALMTPLPPPPKPQPPPLPPLPHHLPPTAPPPLPPPASPAPPPLVPPAPPAPAQVPVPVPTASSVLIPPVPAVPPEPALDPVGQARAMRILLAQRARKERRKNHVRSLRLPHPSPTRSASLHLICSPKIDMIGHLPSRRRKGTWWALLRAMRWQLDINKKWPLFERAAVCKDVRVAAEGE
ncbi:hypothetical protein CYMTET_30592, partial [Cymbomonas tetramitiformis]